MFILTGILSVCKQTGTDVILPTVFICYRLFSIFTGDNTVLQIPFWQYNLSVLISFPVDGSSYLVADKLTSFKVQYTNKAVGTKYVHLCN